MPSPPYSKATGKSGPKRKTGCITCRKRKVRCDESKPICKNCTRLQLGCTYTDGRRNSLRSRSGTVPLQDSQSVQSVVSSKSGIVMEDEMYLDPLTSLPFDAQAPIQQQQYQAEPRLTEIHCHQTFQPSIETSGGWGPASTPESLLTSPFQDLFFSSIDLRQSEQPISLINKYGFDTISHRTGGASSQSQDDTENFEGDVQRDLLLEYFFETANPISIVMPIHTEWKFACKSLLAMAHDSPCLLNAIYALSAANMFITEDKHTADTALSYYKLASTEVNKIFTEGDFLDDRKLKQAFATIFLLSHVEVMIKSIPDAAEKPQEHMRTAYNCVRRYSDRIMSWTGISRRLLTWMALLETKAEYAGGALAPLDSSTLSHLSSSTKNDLDNYADTVDDHWTAVDMVYDAISQPAFEFFVKSQGFTRKIIKLDRWHRHRDTLEADFEILQIGHQVSKELHELWKTRPPSFNVLAKPESLSVALQPQLARRILQNLRVYVANFQSQFIYLHRVAFIRYPCTDDVINAVSTILKEARAIVEDVHQNGDMSESCLPPTMLWPLFLAALECDIEDRTWVLEMMRELKGVPSAPKTLELLKEVTRRQDDQKERVDQRFVRRELFGSEYDVIY